MKLVHGQSSISEAQKFGVSRLLQDAEEHGLMFVYRHSSFAGLVLPGTIMGFANLRKVLKDDSSLRKNPELQELARILSVLLEEEE